MVKISDLVEEIKTVLRISHNKLNGEIESNIEIAKAEMVRVGVLKGKAEDETDPLIKQAIKTYCQKEMLTDDKKVERCEKSWLYQIDNLRKSKGYGFL